MLLIYTSKFGDLYCFGAEENEVVLTGSLVSRGALILKVGATGPEGWMLHTAECPDCERNADGMACCAYMEDTT